MQDSTSSDSKRRTAEAFEHAPSRHPLVVGHMCKQDKNNFSFSKRYFALYEGKMLAYYNHERDFKDDVKKHQGVPLHCTLVKLDDLYLERPKHPPHGVKHCFKLHTPEKSNHRHEFLLVCQRKKDMNIWIEQLQSQNPHLTPPHRQEQKKPHRTPSYIKRMRLNSLGTNSSLTKLECISRLDSSWLQQTSCAPGDIALTFHIGSSDDLAKPQLPAHK